MPVDGTSTVYITINTCKYNWSCIGTHKTQINAHINISKSYLQLGKICHILNHFNCFVNITDIVQNFTNGPLSILEESQHLPIICISKANCCTRLCVVKFQSITKSHFCFLCFTQAIKCFEEHILEIFNCIN